jgi:hypothetical protein
VLNVTVLHCVAICDVGWICVTIWEGRRWWIGDVRGMMTLVDIVWRDKHDPNVIAQGPGFEE